jgi:hypothetical protein
LDGVKTAGMLRGAYHIRARVNWTPQQEADYFLSHIGPYIDGRTILVLDWEECDTSDETWALTFLQIVEGKTGIKPWFYVNMGDLIRYQYHRIAANGNAIWLAQYPYNTVQGFAGAGWTPQAIPAGHTLVAWQYVGTGGNVNGITGLDLSAAYITAAGWVAYASPHNATQATTITPIQEETLSAADVQEIKEYLGELLLYGYTSGGVKHPGIGMVVEQSQRDIRDVPANVWNTPVNRGAQKVPALQELADAKTAAQQTAAHAASPSAAVDVNALAEAVAAKINAAQADAFIIALRTQLNK